MNENVIVNLEIKNSIPPLAPEEYNLLEKSILEKGCRDKIIVWCDERNEPEKKYCKYCYKDVKYTISDGGYYQCDECDSNFALIEYTIVDGHNRYEICKKHDIEFETEIYEFDDIEEVLDFIDENQLGRRNLTDEQRNILIGRRYNRGKKEGFKGNQYTKVVDAKIAPTKSEELADEYKISERTVKNYGKLATAFEEMKAENPELAKDLFEGKTTFKKIKKDKKLKKLEEKKEEYIEKFKADMIIIPEVHLMSCQDYLKTFADNSIDLFYTDPPYMTDIPEGKIGEFTDSWLPLAIEKTKKSGRMLVFSGAYPMEIQAFLNVLLNQDKFIVDNPLVWVFNNTLGVTPKMKYNLNYQFIWHLYSKDSPELDTSITNDMFSAQVENAPDGRQGNKLHTWQKPDDLAIKHIEQTTKKGDIVVDPFTCTGTFLIAASKLGRIGKGCDIDQTNLNIAISRGCKLINNEKIMSEEDNE